MRDHQFYGLSFVNYSSNELSYGESQNLEFARFWNKILKIEHFPVSKGLLNERKLAQSKP